MRRFIVSCGGGVGTIGSMAGAVWVAANGGAKPPADKHAKLAQRMPSRENTGHRRHVARRLSIIDRTRHRHRPATKNSSRLPQGHGRFQKTARVEAVLPPQSPNLNAQSGRFSAPESRALGTNDRCRRRSLRRPFAVSGPLSCERNLIKAWAIGSDAGRRSWSDDGCRPTP